MAELMEGLPVGQKVTSGGRTISEGDFTLLTNLTWTTTQIHSNREYMKSTQFGERVLAGPCTLAIAIGLTCHEVDRLLASGGVRIVALLGFENVVFRAPVVPGDTLWGETEILNARPTRKPDRGLMRIRDVVSKQSGEVVMESIRSILFERPN